MQREIKKDGRTLTKEQIYMDLSKLSEEEINKATSLAVSPENMDTDLKASFLCKYLAFYPKRDTWFALGKDWDIGKTEITYPDFLQLFGESELTELPEEKESNKTCAGSSKMEPTRTRAENAKVEEKSNEMLEGYKAILEENGYFVFPKAPEGEFPDLTGFKGVNMECLTQEGASYTAFSAVLKYNNLFYGQNGYGGLNRFYTVRPIQKTKPTLSELWKLAEEAGVDLSEFEKPE